MKINNSLLRLYLVTDRSWLRGETLETSVERCLRAGVTLVQLREKELDEATFVQQALRMKAVTDRWNVPLIINDKVRVAQQADAAGVHLGQSDADVREARRVLGADRIIGVSARTVEQAIQAERDGADYLGVGAVFPTGTKKDAHTISPAVLAEIHAQVQLPIVAIGGITPQNILELTHTGADGVAVISAILAQPDVAAATRKLRMLSDRMVTE